jgi:hypothetical protein
MSYELWMMNVSTEDEIMITILKMTENSSFITHHSSFWSELWIMSVSTVFEMMIPILNWTEKLIILHIQSTSSLLSASEINSSKIGFQNFQKLLKI